MKAKMQKRVRHRLWLLNVRHVIFLDNDTFIWTDLRRNQKSRPWEEAAEELGL